MSWYVAKLSFELKDNSPVSKIEEQIRLFRTDSEHEGIHKSGGNRSPVCTGDE